MISIVIPAYGNIELLQLCISHLDFCTLEKEIIVVDDGYGMEVDGAKILKHSKNRGFAASVNTGIDASKGEVIAIINSDVLILSGCLENMVGALDRADIIGAKLYYPDGAIQHAGSLYSGNYMFCHTHFDRPSCYMLVTGALMVFKKELVETIGRFDEKFFIAYEDVDFCLRAIKAGFKVIYLAEAQAIHIEGATRGNTLETKKIKNLAAMKKEDDSRNYFKSKYLEEEIRRLCKPCPLLP